ncbi:Hypothetical predicted protein [Podarcis lilfordi]|uniref:Uncharacterized protein n=1 Tax=Podarcis lilfordi TaxID=74358 RepID=A0AA35K1U0_9SAUR|nr:Hypothetical predicted protein [Podarcis lilfordi]
MTSLSTSLATINMRSQWPGEDRKKPDHSRLCVQMVDAGVAWHPKFNGQELMSQKQGTKNL